MFVYGLAWPALSRPFFFPAGWPQVGRALGEVYIQRLRAALDVMSVHCFVLRFHLPSLLLLFVCFFFSEQARSAL